MTTSYQTVDQTGEIPEILAKSRNLLEQSLLSNTQVVYEQLPPTNKYKYWDVYIGKAGIALMFMKIHQRDPAFTIDSKSALTIANEYIDNALAKYKASHSSHAVGFLCSEVGLYAIAALVKHHIGDQDSCNRYLNFIQTHGYHSCFSLQTPSEVLYGRAGYLYTQKFISGLISSSTLGSAQPIIDAVFDSIIEDGKRTATKLRLESNTPMFWTFQDDLYIGAAHGAAGILTILLGFPVKAQNHAHEIQDTCDFILFKNRTNFGNWPTALEDGAKELVHWCHGAPGICLLACKAFEFFKDQKYLDLAESTAEFVHTNGVIYKGCGLCHGVAGNAYSFLVLYQLTKKEKYLEWAIEFAVICTQWKNRTSKGEFRVPDHPWSLFEGLAGTLCFIADLYYWDAKLFKGFPAFTDI